MLLYLLLLPNAIQSTDLEKYMDIAPGNLPIVISAPHGGKQLIPGVPTRTGGPSIQKFTTVLDTNTLELAEALILEIEREFGAKPYIVLARFTRKQIDANRPPEHSYEHPRAKPYYDHYHQGLEQACRSIRKEWGAGIVLDLHAQGKSAGLIYRGTQNLKTVKLLRDRFGMPAINGPNSLLGLLSAKGYGIYPGVDQPITVKEEPSYSGGWITMAYGADSGLGLDAMQLEIGANYRSKTRLKQTAADLAFALKQFSRHYLPQEKRQK